VGQFVPDGLRPHLLGDVSVVGKAPPASVEGGQFILDGVWIEGKLTVLKGNLRELRIAHTSLMPSQGGVGCTVDNPALAITLSHTITGPIALPDSVPVLNALDTVIDGEGGQAIQAAGVAASLERCTVIGGTSVRTLEASEVIFTAPVVAARRQTGCVRFSFVPDGSKTPRRYRCQPDIEVAAQIARAEKQGIVTAAEKVEIRSGVIGWLAPAFTSVVYGDPAYGQLTLSCPRQVREGAEDTAEMGIFHDLLQPQRAANLRAGLDEYLRAGLEAGIFYVS
jgi:hypothetical protein